MVDLLFLYRGTVSVLLLIGRLIFFSCICTVYTKRILHCNDPEQLTVLAWAERLMVEKVLLSCLGK